MVAKTRNRQRAKHQEGPDPAVLDLEHLRRYTMDSAELERELIGLFLKQLPGLMDELRNAVDVREWKFATHTLKGSARVIGAVGIANVAAALEAKGLCKETASLDAAVSAFMKAAEILNA
jgi:HPt (histidine-containing phosphotransfer) domain-containing protein